MYQNPTHHLLIAGTGRAGTSYLVRLLHSCGLDTHLGSESGTVQWHESAAAGFEDLPNTTSKKPYVVKSPWSYQYPKSILQSNDIVIDQVLIPIRDLREAALSRVVVERQRIIQSSTGIELDEDIELDWGSAAGGMVFSLSPLDQARTLALSLHILIEDLTELNIPFTFLKYPRFSKEADYCFEKIVKILPENIKFEVFQRIHAEMSVLGSARIDDSHFETHELEADVKIRFPSAAQISLIAARREIKNLNRQIENLDATIKRLTADFESISSQNHTNYSENMLIREKLADLIATIRIDNQVK